MFNFAVVWWLRIIYLKKMGRGSAPSTHRSHPSHVPTYTPRWRQGENDDAFVLGAVKEIPGQPVATGLRRVYWLDDVDGLRGKAGQVVRIEGRIDGIEEGKMEVKPGQAEDGGTLVELEGPGRDVDTTPAAMSVGTAGTTADAPKTPLTLIRLDVDKVTAVRACGS